MLDEVKANPAQLDGVGAELESLPAPCAESHMGNPDSLTYCQNNKDVLLLFF